MCREPAEASAGERTTGERQCGITCRYHYQHALTSKRESAERVIELAPGRLGEYARTPHRIPMRQNLVGGIRMSNPWRRSIVTTLYYAAGANAYGIASH